MDEDFHGYMQAKERAEADRLEQEARLERHRIWRDTTWGGFAVRQVQAVGNHFGPFFAAIADAMRSDGTSSNIAVMVLIRMVMIFFGVAMVYLAASVVQKLIGKD